METNNLNENIKVKPKKEHNIPKLFQKLLKYTKHENAPTDPKLDSVISTVRDMTPWFYDTIKYILKQKTKRIWRYYKQTILKYIFWIAVISALVYFVNDYIYKPYFLIKSKPQIVVKEIYTGEFKSFKRFIEDVGKREASGDWDVESSNNMLGIFQFNPSTLKKLGINVPKEEFLQNKDLQLACFKYLLRTNRKDFEKYIMKYNFRKMKNIKGVVTESGILMAFHLKPADAKVFFVSGGAIIGTGDSKGTRVNEYIEMFSGYDIDLE